MGEYAEIQLSYEMRRGFKSKPRDPSLPKRNPFTATCEICGKKCRNVGGDALAGLRSHMKDKHGIRM